ncbi:unnamed protein product [Adineta steineri]|uniref:ubiquitinyl hydrolase 1 n=1 Tax=Adineta steineri TaxID=433720 RepID=A0A815H429_9BILA|nr:unnamed protein product [Adineta steineri]
MISCVECSECKYMSNEMEPYFVWSVPINGHTSLLSALDAFCRPEYLAGENAYSCTYCSKYVQAVKRLSIVHVSLYIIFSFKRFRSGLHNTQKLTHFVTYPEILDISSYFSSDYQKVSGSNNENLRLKFRPYCVIVHLGSEVQNGHLFAYIRAADDKWYKANDWIITPVKLDEVLSTHNAYLLFYAATESISPAIKSPLETNLPSPLTNSLQRIGDSSQALYLSNNQHSLVRSLPTKHL